MYESYWQLSAKPFDPSADERWYYPSEIHQSALLKLRYAIENRRGAALLTGAAGTGKSLVVKALRKQLPGTFAPFVHLVFPQMTSRELLAYLADELGAAPAISNVHAMDESLHRLERTLTDNTARGRHAVVAIDEAQLLLDTGLLETLRLLLNLEAGSQPALTLLLVGQPALLPALDRMPTFEERIGVKCLLRPLTADETAAYVSHRLRAAGAAREIFTAPAVAALHQLSGGNPRRINRLCDLALLVGFAEERGELGPEQIEAVANELVTVTPE